VKKSVWKKKVGKDASAKGLEPCNQTKGEICSKEKQSVFTIKGGKGGGISICRRPAAKRVHPAI